MCVINLEKNQKTDRLQSEDTKENIRLKLKLKKRNFVIVYIVKFLLKCFLKDIGF